MTKVDLVDQVSDKLQMAKNDLERVLETTIATIQEALKKGDKVSLTGLGMFSVKERKHREARNPKTGEKVQVPAKKAVKFRPGKELKELVQA